MTDLSNSWSELMQSILNSGTFTRCIATYTDAPLIIISKRKRGTRKYSILLEDRDYKPIQTVSGSIILEPKMGTIRLHAKDIEQRNKMYADFKDIIDAETDYGLTYKRVGGVIEQKNEYYQEIDMQIIEKS